MTPQLQQAIRLLQLPTIELQAHIRELLEIQRHARAGRGLRERHLREPAERRDGGRDRPATPEEPQVEVVDDGWAEQSVGPAENPWSGGDDDRQQEFADAAGQSLRDHLLWQLELARARRRASSPSAAPSSMRSTTTAI